MSRRIQDFGAACIGSCALFIFSAAVARAADDPAELSVAPLDQVTYPTDRPRWVVDADNNKPFSMVGDNRVIVLTPLCDSADQCEERLIIAAKVAAHAYAINLVDFVDSENFYEFDDDEVQDLITRRYQGTAKQGDMTVHQAAAELTFSPAKRRLIKRASQNAEVEHRLSELAGFGLLGLLALFGSSALVGMASRVRLPKITTRNR